MLILTRKQNEQIVIGDGEETVYVKVIRTKGGAVTLGIEAPRRVRVDREETRQAKDSSRAIATAEA